MYIFFFSSRRYTHNIFWVYYFSTPCLFIDRFSSWKSCRRACYAPDAIHPTTILSNTDEADQTGKRCCLRRYIPIIHRASRMSSTAPTKNCALPCVDPGSDNHPKAQVIRGLGSGESRLIVLNNIIGIWRKIRLNLAMIEGVQDEFLGYQDPCPVWFESMSCLILVISTDRIRIAFLCCRGL